MSTNEIMHISYIPAGYVTYKLLIMAVFSEKSRDLWGDREHKMFHLYILHFYF